MSIAAPLVRAIHAKSPAMGCGMDGWMMDPPHHSVRDWPPSLVGSSPGVDQISHALCGLFPPLCSSNRLFFLHGARVVLLGDTSGAWHKLGPGPSQLARMLIPQSRIIELRVTGVRMEARPDIDAEDGQIFCGQVSVLRVQTPQSRYEPSKHSGNTSSVYSGKRVPQSECL